MKFKKIYIFLIVFAFLSTTSAAFFYLYGYYINTPLDASNNTWQILVVNKGDGVTVVSQNLFEQKLIKSQLFFKFYIALSGFSSKVKAGTYFLSPNMSIREIADKLVSGSTVKISVTIPEGYSMREIEDKINFQFSIFNFQSIFNHQFSNFTINNFQSEYAFLGDAPDNAMLEGFLFPDTYHFSLDATLEHVVAAMLDNFDKKFTSELRLAAKEQGRTIYEIITMASIIEKEVRSLEDMKLVSGILWKRLKIGMPLQVDATITYLTGKKTVAVTKDDLVIDSPYNTYKYKGLPPGPISNPGLRAIQAAIYPTDSNYFYYLSARDGTTIFSVTLDEHNIARAKYLR